MDAAIIDDKTIHAISASTWASESSDVTPMWKLTRNRSTWQDGRTAGCKAQNPLARLQRLVIEASVEQSIQRDGKAPFDLDDWRSITTGGQAR